MINSNPNTAKKNQKLVKFVLFGAAFVVLIGIIFLLTNDPKRQEYVQQQEVKTKLEASKLVDENDTVKTKWINDVSGDIDISRMDTQKIIKDNEILKKEIEGLKRLFLSNNGKTKKENKKLLKDTENTVSKDSNKMPSREYFGMPKTKSKDLDSSGLFSDFPKPFVEKSTFVPTKKATKTYVKLSQALVVKEIKEDEVFEEDEKSKKKEIIDYLPTGTISKVTLLNGFDAPTMSKAKTNPIPLLMKINDLSILPNKFDYDLKECFVMGEGYGDLSSERVYIRTNNISCVSKTGRTIDMPFKAMVTGEDGKAGLRGRVVSKQGAILARTIIASFVSSVGTAFGNQGQTIIDSISAATGSTTQTTANSSSSSDSFKAGLYKGLESGSNKLADFYLKLADQVFPVIEIDANRNAELISTSRTALKFISDEEKATQDEN
ncbi:TraB/VirB10 family protein [Poseidonibacter ostreae]|uniref:Conjugal transfer protein TraB n=1 Tax=Poseidonibacter ostreae TaxID=2654171 RepID=A0A6L4WQ02_9BACT|nr:TraB/VirB10 family protein [Poseidonibacter ostreae]KAB7884668.1 conjugal transfer protein TraB [Poseidonibacter ostreae]KAB7885185.1 conjugal transfer protein TraB [Poseidonibacter ostreae]KAB7889595.1 conjugal transfer protein TraB [Poseidonibacter ostreae]